MVLTSGRAKFKMATFQRRRKKSSSEAQRCSVKIDGLVAPQVCCRLTSELLKYLLYERQQIPLPYEQIKFDLNRDETARQDTKGKGITPKLKRSKSLFPSSERKRCKHVVDCMEELLPHLEDLFSLTFVPQVLILIGATAVSPKDAYILNFTDALTTSKENSLSAKSCIRSLLREMVTKDFLPISSMPPITNTLLLVKAHRDCGLDWFVPKLTYKLGSRGQQYDISLVGTAHPGLEQVHVEEQGPKDDYIWYQAPISIKGYKEKSVRAAKPEDIWI
ncbi:PREDICTED: MAD2L1-binding protein-like [Branchiostoma belcheri]|uniref:MAD2L1-binding protein-like n=1 Tax=Branchiostoma belcheri TaxID=7741 RepID=A0A6P4Z5H8_BRABE|nr:PREDICTED: MAD2L1-binding protein-like [Branchiostoma belcheri]